MAGGASGTSAGTAGARGGEGGSAGLGGAMVGGSAGAAGAQQAAGASVGGGSQAGGAGRGGAGAVGGAGAGAVGGAMEAGGTGAVGGAGSSAGGSAGVAGFGAAGTRAGGSGGSEPNPLSHLVPSARSVGVLLANRFRAQPLAFDSVASLPGDGYKTACEWYGALGVASSIEDRELVTALVTKFDPLKPNFVDAMTGGEAHVDRYVFGMVPLEIYLQTEDASFRPLGIQTADRQQTTNQTRGAIDDMFMMTGLQLQAYRATGETKYIDFMARTMADYLASQQANGLFFHNETQARVHWGRGNGWFAAGMAEMMRDISAASEHYTTILGGYQRMMAGLLPYQAVNGLWYQVLDLPSDPNNWQETSGTAMFTYAMVAGVRRGVLDAATYVPVIEAAWAGLQSKISAAGDVRDICVGTWYEPNAQAYMSLSRLTGDGHGQAPVLWVAAELLR